MKLTLLIALILLSIPSTAQSVIEYKGEKINALDANNKQTGIWKLYDEQKHLTIVTEFKNGLLIAPTKYYNNSVLIAASYDSGKGLEIYKDNKTYKGLFFREPDGKQAIIDEDGNRIDAGILTYFYESSAIMGMYYGGTTELYSFIDKNVNRKLLGKNRGKAKVKFVIDVKGNTSDIEIIESNNPAINEEVKRIVSILPRWQPAHQAGAFVKCSFVIPITLN
jgi:antitoxin component YwqK of YwqJK toxin-antitoxin module